MDPHRNDPLGPQPDPSNRVQKQSVAEKMAALKARVNAAIGSSKAKGGLNVGLHPALENLGTWSSTQPSKSAPSTNGRGSRHPIDGIRDAPGEKDHSSQRNPYFDESQAAQAPGVKPRQSRPLIFNPKGKHIQQANADRRAAALEAIKKRIAQQAQKAGIDDELGTEKYFAVEEPPSVEWWDEGLVFEKTYQGVDDPAKVKLATSDTIVTEYIQHPVAIEPPQDQQTQEVKPMYLTIKEQKKLRRQRRQAELKDKQTKERLGLIPAAPPKVGKGNLMRVLGEAVVKDPTAVEAQVNRQIMERNQKHMQANEERKLTKEQKQEKLAAKQEKDAAKGIHLLVFKVASLANGQHRFKIGKNAEQLALTGVCIIHPRLNLVIVEGGERAIRTYRKLIINRIDWTENSASRQQGDSQGPARPWLVAEDEGGSLKDLSFNKMDIVFEGQVKLRAFKKWGSKVCETDVEARDLLSRHKMEHFWAQAKSVA